MNKKRVKEDKNKQACAFLNKQTKKKERNHTCLRFIYLNYSIILFYFDQITFLEEFQ